MKKSTFLFAFTVTHCIVTLLTQFRADALAHKNYGLPITELISSAHLSVLLSFPLGRLADWLASQLDPPYFVPLVFLLNSFLWALVVWHASALVQRFVRNRTQ